MCQPAGGQRRYANQLRLLFLDQRRQLVRQQRRFREVQIVFVMVHGVLEQAQRYFVGFVAQGRQGSSRASHRTARSFPRWRGFRAILFGKVNGDFRHRIEHRLMLVVGDEVALQITPRKVQRGNEKLIVDARQRGFRQPLFGDVQRLVLVRASSR